MSRVLSGVVCSMVVMLLGGCGDIDCKRLDDGTFECLPVTPTPTPEATPEPTPEPTPAPTPPRERNPNCTRIMGTDGPGGFLWKPRGENSGNLVILLPGKFQSEFETVTVFRDNRRKTPESLRFTGFSNYDPDGLRQTWRGTRKGADYTGEVVAEGGNPSQICEWVVENPERRQD